MLSIFFDRPSSDWDRLWPCPDHLLCRLGGCSKTTSVPRTSASPDLAFRRAVWFYTTHRSLRCKSLIVGHWTWDWWFACKLWGFSDNECCWTQQVSGSSRLPMVTDASGARTREEGFREESSKGGTGWKTSGEECVWNNPPRAQTLQSCQT